MLPRQFRLKRSKLFPKTMAAGKPLCNNPYFLMLGLKRAFESSTPTRFGFIVSKKVANRANRRNRIKRRLREIVRKDLIAHPRMEKMRGYIAVIFIARKSVLEASYKELQETLLNCLQSR